MKHLASALTAMFGVPFKAAPAPTGPYVDRNPKGHVQCYLSRDCKSVETFHGEAIGSVLRATRVRCRRSWVHGTTMVAVKVRLSSDGKLYYGRGNGGLAITLRAYKNQGA